MPKGWAQVLSQHQPRDEAIMDDEDEDDSEENAKVPRARCAHQVVYDSKTKTVYMHGGNAGITTNGVDAAKADSPPREETRLDDFWSMTLKRYLYFLRAKSAFHVI